MSNTTTHSSSIEPGVITRLPDGQREATWIPIDPLWSPMSRGDLLLVLDRLGGPYAAIAGELRATWGIAE